MKIKILNTIGLVFSNEAKKILEKFGDFDYLNLKSQKQLANVIGKYDIVVIGLSHKYDK